MYRRTMTYTDYFGTERTEDVYFNLNQAELTKLQLSTQNGYVDMLQRLIDAKDGPAIMETFDKIIRMAYGEKSSDGRRFIKSEELSEAFTQTPMYEALYMELCTDAKAAAEFVKAILPEQLIKQAEQQNTITDVVRQNS
jgi:hypothetical protein